LALIAFSKWKSFFWTRIQGFIQILNEKLNLKRQLSKAFSSADIQFIKLPAGVPTARTCTRTRRLEFNPAFGREKEKLKIRKSSE